MQLAATPGGTTNLGLAGRPTLEDGDMAGDHLQRSRLFSNEYFACILRLADLLCAAVYNRWRQVDGEVVGYMIPARLQSSSREASGDRELLAEFSTSHLYSPLSSSVMFVT